MKDHTEIFKSTDEILEFAKTHVKQKDKEELDDILSMPPESILVYALWEGIINGMYQCGYDITKYPNLTDITNEHE